MLRTDCETIPVDPDDATSGGVVGEVVEQLERMGVWRDGYSSSVWAPHGWYSVETYLHPYTGEREERTAHLVGFTDDESRRVHAVITARRRHRVGSVSLTKAWLPVAEGATGADRP